MVFIREGDRDDVLSCLMGNAHRCTPKSVMDQFLLDFDDIESKTLVSEGYLSNLLLEGWILRDERFGHCQPVHLSTERRGSLQSTP